MTTPKLVEHFFRHEYGRLVAMLSCRVGAQHIEAVEDAVQSALMKALEAWTRTGLPANPSAWLGGVARASSWLGRCRKLRTTGLAGWFLLVGGGTGRSTSALRKRPLGATLSAGSIQIGANLGVEDAFAAATPGRHRRFMNYEQS